MTDEERENLYKKWQETVKTVSCTEGAYGRAVLVQIGFHICDLCGKQTEVMEVDTSDGEYSSFTCCKNCLDDLWSKK